MVEIEKIEKISNFDDHFISKFINLWLIIYNQVNHNEIKNKLNEMGSSRILLTHKSKLFIARITLSHHINFQIVVLFFEIIYLIIIDNRNQI